MSQQLTPAHSGTRVELNLRTVDDPHALFELVQEWRETDSGEMAGYVVCMHQQPRMNDLDGRIGRLREPLDRRDTRQEGEETGGK